MKYKLLKYNTISKHGLQCSPVFYLKYLIIDTCNFKAKFLETVSFWHLVFVRDHRMPYRSIRGEVSIRKQIAWPLHSLFSSVLSSCSCVIVWMFSVRLRGLLFTNSSRFTHCMLSSAHYVCLRIFSIHLRYLQQSLFRNPSLSGSIYVWCCKSMFSLYIRLICVVFVLLCCQL